MKTRSRSFVFVLGLTLALIAVFAPQGLLPLIVDGVEKFIKALRREPEEEQMQREA